MNPRPRKRFGQHWLQSPVVLSQIIQAANLSPSDCVMEIGPGQGVLTEKLLAKVERVVSIEIDRDLCAYLRKHFHQYPHFQLMEADFLQVPFGLDCAPLELDPVNLDPVNLDPVNLDSINKVVANIPYNITSPILDKLLGTIHQPLVTRLDTIVLLLQNEVAQRLAAKPGSKVFGALSVRIQYLAHCEVLFKVPPSAFNPAPKVESAVIRLTPRSYPNQSSNPRWMGVLVKHGFAMRRKMLRNTLQSIVDKSSILAAFAQLEVDSDVRAEALGLDQWVQLSEILVPSQGN